MLKQWNTLSLLHIHLWNHKFCGLKTKSSQFIDPTCWSYLHVSGAFHSSSCSLCLYIPCHTVVLQPLHANRSLSFSSPLPTYFRSLYSHDTVQVLILLLFIGVLVMFLYHAWSLASPPQPQPCLNLWSLLCFLALISRVIHQQPFPPSSLANMKLFFSQSFTPLYQWLVYYFFHLQ